MPRRWMAAVAVASLLLAGIAIAGPAFIEFTIIDPSGRPRVGTQIVRITPDGEERPVFEGEVTLNPKGSGRSKTLQPGKYMVSVLWPPLPGAAGLVDTAAGGALTQFQLRGRPGAEVSGHVVLPTGRPVPGVLVIADYVARKGAYRRPWTAAALARLKMQGDLPGTIATSGEDGAFTLEAVQRGRVCVAALAMGFTGVEIPVCDLGTAPARGLKVAICPPRTRVPVLVRVEDTSGRPIPGAGIRVVPPGGVPADYAAPDPFGDPYPTTDAEGTVSLDLVPAGEAVVWAVLAGHVPAGEPIPSGRDKLTIRLVPGAAVSGRVLGPEGKPLRGRRVAVVPGPEAGDLAGFAASEVWTVLTEADGAFLVGGLPPGPVAVRVAKGGGSERAAGFDALLAQDGDLRLPDAVVLSTDGGRTVKGSVEILAASPWKPTRAMALPAGLSSDAAPIPAAQTEVSKNGTFLLSDVPSVQMRLAVEFAAKDGDGAMTIVRDLGEKDEQVAVAAWVGGTVKVTAPLAGLRDPRVLLDGPATVLIRMNPDGRFEAQGLPPGRYRVRLATKAQGPVRGAEAEGDVVEGVEAEVRL